MVVLVVQQADSEGLMVVHYVAQIDRALMIAMVIVVVGAVVVDVVA